jgi:hypothetical protein
MRRRLGLMEGMVDVYRCVTTGGSGRVLPQMEAVLWGNRKNACFSGGPKTPQPLPQVEAVPLPQVEAAFDFGGKETRPPGPSILPGRAARACLGGLVYIMETPEETE